MPTRPRNGYVKLLAGPGTMRDCAGQHVFAAAMIETNARVNLEPRPVTN